MPTVTTVTTGTRSRRSSRAADVLVENLPEPVRTRWGCDVPQLEALNDRLVVVSVSAYGRSGPYADRPGAGTLAEAHAGLTHMTGEADGPPTLASVAIGDTLTAFAGVIGAIAACWSRDARSGPGRHVDVSMYEPVLAIMGSTIAGWDTESAPPARSGSRVHGARPATCTGRATTATSRSPAPPTRRSPACCRCSGRTPRTHGAGSVAPPIVRAPPTSSTASSPTGSRHGTATTVVTALLDARIPVSPVNDVRDVVTDAQVLARESLVAIGDADPVTVPAPLPRVSGSRRAPRPAPALDGDRDAVLDDWLA